MYFRNLNKILLAGPEVFLMLLKINFESTDKEDVGLFSNIYRFLFWELFPVGGLIRAEIFRVKSKIGFMRSLTARSCQTGRRGEFSLLYVKLQTGCLPS